MATCNYGPPSPMRGTGNNPEFTRSRSQSSAMVSPSAQSFALSFEHSNILSHVVVGFILFLSLVSLVFIILA